MRSSAARSARFRFAVLVSLIVAGCGGGAHPIARPAVTGKLGVLLPCAAANLSAAWVNSGGTAGTEVTRVQLVNHGGHGCVLLGHPVSLAGVRPSGRIVSLSGGGWSGPGSPFVGDEPAVLEAHGGAADLALSTTSATSCVNGPGLPALNAIRIGLPTGTVTARWYPHTDPGPLFSFPCPPTMSSFALWTNVPGVGFTRVPGVIGLEATADPASFPVPGARTLHYSVTLRDISAATVRLQPCPTFSEDLTVTRYGHDPQPRQVASAFRQLPCSKQDTIAPGHAQTFPITITRPHVAADGRGVFEEIEWRLHGLDGFGPETTLNS